MVPGSKIKFIVNTGVVMMLAVFISGCATGIFSTGTKSEESSGEASQPKKTTAVYYDFEDVLVPTELSIVKKKTMVVSSPGFTSGILSLKGRVERRSLINFFNHNMQKDNWNIVSQIKSPSTTIMVFQKTTKTAVITIRDDQIYTYAEVGVAPTVSTDPGLLEPDMSKDSELLELDIVE